MPDGPLILAFDTSAAHCAAALLSGDIVLASAHEEMQRGQAERLMPLLTDVMEAAGRCLADLDAIGVGIGPGNFTGTRIAVAAARGLALGLGVPAIGVSSFEIAHAAQGGPRTVILQGTRGTVFAQDFAEDHPASAPRLEEAESAPPPELIDWREGAATTGRIAGRKFSAGGTARPAPLYVRPPDALPAKPAPPVR